MGLGRDLPMLQNSRIFNVHTWANLQKVPSEARAKHTSGSRFNLNKQNQNPWSGVPSISK